MKFLDRDPPITWDLGSKTSEELLLIVEQRLWKLTWREHIRIKVKRIFNMQFTSNRNKFYANWYALEALHILRNRWGAR